MNNGPLSHKLNPCFSIRNIFFPTIRKTDPHTLWPSSSSSPQIHCVHHIINVMPNNYTKVTLKTWFICCPLESKKKLLDGPKNHFISQQTHSHTHLRHPPKRLRLFFSGQPMYIVSIAVLEWVGGCSAQSFRLNDQETRSRVILLINDLIIFPRN